MFRTSVTLRKLIGVNTVENATLSLEVARANPSASRDYARAWLTLEETSCSNTLELVKLLAPNGLSGKTCLEFFPLTEDGLSRPSSKRWLNCGLGGGCAWRVLDAQFFGVAQRRRRVFVVINTRDWRRAPAVLFEPGSLCGHNPSSREKREELTRTARICFEGDCEPGCLTPWDNESKRIFSHDGTAPTLYSATTSGQQQLAVLTPWDVQSKRVYSSEGIAPSLQSGTNEGMNIQPIVMTEANSEAEAVCIQGSMIGRSDKNGPQGDGLNEDVSFTLNTTDRHAVAYECMGDSSAVAFAQNSRDELRIVGGDGSYVGALAASPGMKQQCYIMEQAEESGVICMSDTQSNTSIGEIPSITAHSQKDAPVICIADDNTNAAIDKDLCGSLKVGGGYP